MQDDLMTVDPEIEKRARILNDLIEQIKDCELRRNVYRALVLLVSACAAYEERLLH